MIEAWGLGVFMISACLFGVLIFNPQLAPKIENVYLQRGLMGLAMGATAIAIFYSPWGKRSGAHINPAVTLTFFRLGKIKHNDAIFYILAQFIGGTIGVLISWIILGNLLEDSMVNFVVTAPSAGYGNGTAFIAEAVISFLMMTTVLIVSNSSKIPNFTPLFAGVLVALFITFENPFSGMSMNPARTFSSAAIANNFTAWWVYFIAPTLAMFLAAEVYVRIKGTHSVICAKLHHQNLQPCIFNCGYAMKKAVKSNVIEVTKQSRLFTTPQQLF